jgi:tetratricopeptide (TPR) repeat protein
MKPQIIGIAFAGLVAMASGAAAQSTFNSSKIQLRDGTTLETDTVKGARDGYVSVNRELAPGVVAQIDYNPKMVEKIEFPENPRLKRAMQLIDLGRPAEALALINPVLADRQKLAAVRGNDAAASAVIKVKALAGLKREQEARQIIDQLTKNADDPEVIRAALVEIMAVWARSGEYQKADNYYDKAIAESTNPQTIATAWCRKGDALLALEQYDAALLAYLRVPTLYSDQETVLPASLLGAAEAYLGLEDKTHAVAVLKKLIRGNPASPEAAKAKIELAKLNSDSTSPTNDTEYPPTTNE